MTLTKNQILTANDLETREVDVPEWGGSVTVKALSGKERDAWEASLRVTRGKQTAADTSNIRAKLVARALIGDDGERLFSDQDIAALGDKSALVLDRLFDVIAEMSGLSNKADEDAEKNSQDVPSEASTSDSPETSE